MTYNVGCENIYTKMLLAYFATMIKLFLILSASTLCFSSLHGKECSHEQDVCEYWFIVDEQLTMVDKIHNALLFARDGKLIRADDNKTEADPDNVISVDGVPRMVITVNRTIPGPPIIVYENQQIIVHVQNDLLSSSLTIHWHGLHQRGTNHMDGVGFITQCPISAGQKFTYRFKAEPKGTYWYHSHVGAQRTNGFFGALIIKERPIPGVIDPIDAIMTVGDWHHINSEEAYVRAIYGNYPGRFWYQGTNTVDGGHFSSIPWVSGLIEGRGRYTNPKTGHQVPAPLTWYKVKSNSVYRFRIIQVGAMYPLRISVDDHRLTIIATDGYDVVPTNVESVIVNPGERYDFLLFTINPIANYWIRAESIEDISVEHSVRAILHYKGADETKEPVTQRRKCTHQNPCNVLNCPFGFYPDKLTPHTNCILISELQSVESEDNVPKFTEDSEEHFLNFAFPQLSGETPGSVNGRKFENPGIYSFEHFNPDSKYECRSGECGKDKICYCRQELVLPYNKTVQLVLTNMGAGAGWGHPIHMHGHSFQVLKLAYGRQDRETGKLLPYSKYIHEDIDCGGGFNFCNEPKWTKKSWKYGNVPGLNLINPIRKDTIIIPTGGYAVVRIRTNNPGKWFMHCHVELHALSGMALILTEAIEHVDKKYRNFTHC